MQKRVYYRETISFKSKPLLVECTYHDLFRLLNFRKGFIFELHIREGVEKYLAVFDIILLQLIFYDIICRVCTNIINSLVKSIHNKYHH